MSFAVETQGLDGRITTVQGGRRCRGGREREPGVARVQPVRCVSYRYDTPTPAAVVGRLLSHVANNHLIPATEDVAPRA